MTLRIECRVAQRRNVVEHPERAAHRRDRKIAANDLQVGHRGDAEVLLEHLPVFTVVEGNEHAPLRAGKQQAFADGVFAHDANWKVVRNAAGDLLPATAEVFGPVDVGLPVAELVAQYRDVGLRGVMRRRLDRIDPATRRQPARRHVLPALAAILRNVHGAIVGAGPDDAGPHRRFANAVERAVVLLAGDITSDRTAGDDLGSVLERGQVGRNRLPGLAAIGRDVHVL